MPDNALDVFIEKRVEAVVEELKVKLNGMTIDVIDTKQVTGQGQ